MEIKKAKVDKVVVSMMPKSKGAELRVLEIDKKKKEVKVKILESGNAVKVPFNYEVAVIKESQSKQLNKKKKGKKGDGASLSILLKGGTIKSMGERLAKLKHIKLIDAKYRLWNLLWRLKKSTSSYKVSKDKKSGVYKIKSK